MICNVPQPWTEPSAVSSKRTSTSLVLLRNRVFAGASWIDQPRHSKLADVTASTDGDHNAAQLLHRGFDLVQQWSDQLVAAKKSMDTGKYTTSPNAWREDPLSQKVINCGYFSTPMLGSGTYHDNGSCN